MKIQLTAALGDVDVPVNFRYERRDPYAVAMTIVTRPPVTWLFHRGLLHDGLSRPAGDGAVRVSSGGMTVGIGLDGCNGKGILVFQRDDITNLVQLLDKVVPFGREVIDWSKASALFPGIELADAVEGGAS
ncbi:SsgA family sporulation/cell division regulator [Amycolatopsis speibonae]|uniref:SsgA family sporulation/cell division regulator n=1 Tax=Amycolatopsis speibonae TaxID=1450224 RepID=A0ABV7P8G4_9PSEU